VNKNVFSAALNESTVWWLCSQTGSSFHAFGAAMDSLTCKPLDADKVQNSTFSMPHWSGMPYWSSAVEFGITGYYDPGRLHRAGSQDTNLSSLVPVSTFCCTVWSQRTNVTDRQTDVISLHKRDMLYSLCVNLVSYAAKPCWPLLFFV